MRHENDMTPPMIEQYCEIAPGRRLKYLTNGNVGKPRLLMLHGVNTRAEYFDEFFPFVTGDYEIFAPDFRGHGSSFRSDEPYSLANYAQDIGAFIEALVPGPFSFIGMSLGGRIGLLLARQYGHLMKKAVVVDVGPDVDPAGLERIVKAQAQLPASFADRDALYAFYQEAYRSVSLHYIERIVRNSWKALPDGRMVPSYDRNIWRTGPEMFAQDAAMLNAVVPQIETPILIIRGALSDILTPQDARNFVARLRHGTLVEIPDTTHGVILEAPEYCAAIINDFFHDRPVAGAQ
jgi:pimeloyl-ACP methyl ester carboxylesterase